MKRREPSSQGRRSGLRLGEWNIRRNPDGTDNFHDYFDADPSEASSEDISSRHKLCFTGVTFDSSDGSGMSSRRTKSRSFREASVMKDEQDMQNANGRRSRNNSRAETAHDGSQSGSQSSLRRSKSKCIDERTVPANNSSGSRMLRSTNEARSLLGCRQPEERFGDSELHETPLPRAERSVSFSCSRSASKPRSTAHYQLESSEEVDNVNCNARLGRSSVDISKSRSKPNRGDHGSGLYASPETVEEQDDASFGDLQTRTAKSIQKSNNPQRKKSKGLKEFPYKKRKSSMTENILRDEDFPNVVPMLNTSRSRKEDKSTDYESGHSSSERHEKQCNMRARVKTKCSRSQRPPRTSQQREQVEYSQEMMPEDLEEKDSDGGVPERQLLSGVPERQLLSGVPERQLLRSPSLSNSLPKSELVLRKHKSNNSSSVLEANNPSSQRPRQLNNSEAREQVDKMGKSLRTVRESEAELHDRNSFQTDIPDCKTTVCSNSSLRKPTSTGNSISRDKLNCRKESPRMVHDDFVNRALHEGRRVQSNASFTSTKNGHSSYDRQDDPYSFDENERLLEAEGSNLKSLSPLRKPIESIYQLGLQQNSSKLVHKDFEEQESGVNLDLPKSNQSIHASKKTSLNRKERNDLAIPSHSLSIEDQEGDFRNDGLDHGANLNSSKPYRASKSRNSVENLQNRSASKGSKKPNAYRNLNAKRVSFEKGVNSTSQKALNKYSDFASLERVEDDSESENQSLKKPRGRASSMLNSNGSTPVERSSRTSRGKHLTGPSPNVNSEDMDVSATSESSPEPASVKRKGNASPRISGIPSIRQHKPTAGKTDSKGVGSSGQKKAGLGRNLSDSTYCPSMIVTPPLPRDRPQRNRIRPLAFWKGEYRSFVYRRDGDMVLVETHLVPESPKKVKKTREDDTPSSGQIRLEDPASGEGRDLVTVFKDLEWEASDGGHGYKVARTEFSEEYTGGFVELERGGSKGIMYSPTSNLRFMVVQGSAEFHVEDQVAVLNRRDSILVPQGLSYSIRNMHNGLTLLYFSSLPVREL